MVQHTVNEFFFIPDPDHLIATHFPDNPTWQLLAQPITFQQFESHVYLRDRFFELSLSISDERLKSAIVPSLKGRAVIELWMPPERSSKYDFRYLLFRSRLTCGAPPTAGGVGGDSSPLPIDRYVMYEKKSDRVRYTFRCPVVGQFKLEIFGVELEAQDSFDLVCAYLIVCDEPDSGAKPLPDSPDIGWGPTAITSQVNSL